MTHTTLQSALEAWYGIERRKAKLDLEGTRALLAALGHPERRFRAVHVAGTNGKGSTCALVERVLREAGYRTGLFTSPHLVDFRERFRVCGRWADEAWLFGTLRRIEALPESHARTFFEVATALGFAWFADQQVEWAVVEVGLGGRLDTTNVLSPEVSVITGIGLDHTEILGETLTAIASEKAGVIKPGVPVVIGPLPREADDVIRAIARERGAPLTQAASGEVGPLARAAPVAAGPLAPIAAANAGVAVAVIEALRARGVAVSDTALEAGLRAARWPGRFERSPHAPRLWWDGAHNVDGARALHAAAAPAAPFDALVFAASRDKDAAGMLSALRPLCPARRLFVTRTRSERARPLDQLAAAGRAEGFAVETCDSIGDACLHALAAGDGPVLLTGSLFAVGEAMEIYGGAPGADL